MRRRAPAPARRSRSAPLADRARARDAAGRGPAGLAGGRRRRRSRREAAPVARARRRDHRRVLVGGLGAGARPAVGARRRRASTSALGRAGGHGGCARDRPGRPAREQSQELSRFCSTFDTSRRRGSGGSLCYSYEHSVFATPRPSEPSSRTPGRRDVDRRTRWHDDPDKTSRARAATTPRTSPSSRASRPCASGPACTSARPACAACTTSSTRSSTTPSTRRSPATATAVDGHDPPRQLGHGRRQRPRHPRRDRWRRRASRPSRSC